MKRVILLTHSKELHRKTGTGSIIKRILGDRCKIISWDRTSPDKTITESLEKSVLLYPGEDNLESVHNADFSNIILLDGTWQEARKIYNKSPYLKGIRKVSIVSNRKSIYNLRKNQLNYGLCTAESVAFLCDYLGEVQLSKEIILELERVLKR